MAEVYLESVRPKVVDYWAKAGKDPVHIVRKRLAKEVVVAGVRKAKSSRASYIKKNPQKIISVSEELSELKKQVEERKREGVDTSKVEIRLRALMNRVKPFKGKISAGDVKALRAEIKMIGAELGKLGEKGKEGGGNGR